ncbi:MAG: heparinase II/III family protein [Candidatus Hydrogenedentes bacterium]|nr:heparinase II/III family protein [Candidatus Hydrogenedentota bacterium]
MHRFKSIVAVGLVAALSTAFAQEDLADFAKSNSERIKALFDSIDLQKPELASVQAAAVKQDWGKACASLVEYYQNTANPAFPSLLPKPQVDAAAIAKADAVLNDTFTFYDLTDKVPRRPEGGLDWNHTGPNSDKEWAWALNRHFHLDWLLDAYLTTGDAKYAAAWDAQVRDWILQNPFAEPEKNPLVWRGLETHFRVRAWARGFYALQHEPAFSPETRILLLSSIPDHARYLRNFHKQTSNWIAMELYGLAVAGVAWPEFRDAAAWVDYSVGRLTKELDAQVYPDGAQMELTTSYHRVTLSNFQSISDLLQRAGRPVPGQFRDTIERMWDYLAYTLDPTGYSPLNNDSDSAQNAQRIDEAARSFNRPDWTYIATNGNAGECPKDPPSRGFPWAGQLVMRSGWQKDADWAFFDVGPAGIGHRHADKLHLSVVSHGRDVLVDSGRYTYVGGDWRRYFVGTASHNTLLVDGKGQVDKPYSVTEPLDQQIVIAPEYDLGYGIYDSGYAGLEGTATHERLVYYKRGQYWIVLDRINTDRPRSITALWHFHPDCTVALGNLTAASTNDGAGNVRVVPSEGVDWSVLVVSGQEQPVIQGWWSREYNHKVASPTAVYKKAMDTSATFAWLIVPSEGVPPDAKIRIKSVGDWVDCRVKIGQTRDRVRLLFSDEPRKN